MNRYILQAEDAIRLLHDEDPASIELFCGRTMIFFHVSDLTDVCTVHGVPVDGVRTDAVCFTGPDALLGAVHRVFVPLSRPDAAPFWDALRSAAPAHLDFSATENYTPEQCGHDGRRRG